MHVGGARPLRIVTIGDSSVGKTSLLNHLTHSGFDPELKATVAAEFIHLVRTIESETFEMQIWDTAGAERYRALAPIYYRKAVAALVVFDLTNKATFDNLSRWISSYLAIADKQSPIFVLGNKVDLRPELAVSEVNAQEWAEANNYIYFSTSAKDGIGINEAINDLATRLHANKVKLPDQQQIDPIRNEPITLQQEEHQRECGC
jgi:Ras-related protein Rab-11A